MPHPAKLEVPKIDEMGAEKDGVRQTSNKRLFMQLHVFDECRNAEALKSALVSSGLEAVLYEDVMNPLGVGVLFMNHDPEFFVTEVRHMLAHEPFASLQYCPEMTMFGRSYALGHEQNLDEWLLNKPRKTVLNTAWPWAIWYPLRRKGKFEALSQEEKNKTLYEHAMIGMSYGAADFAHDVRLACHGLDTNDNEFVIGLTGKDLYPLSKIIQDMRKTDQTAKYIESLGPFFVGRAYWQGTFADSAS